MSLSSPNSSCAIENKENLNKGKIFIIRESYHTTFMNNDNYKSVYVFSVAVFIILLLDNVCKDLLNDGRIYLGTRTIKNGSQGIHQVFGIWCLMHLPIIGLYYALRIWAQIARSLSKNLSLQLLWNSGCILGFLGFLTATVYVGSKTCVWLDLSFALALAMIMETFRLVMKAYAFVRSNVPRLMENIKDKHVQLAPISSYIYYLFAPTLLYRESYPRTDKIRWSFAIKSLLEVVVVIFVFSFIHERYILPNFEDFGVRSITLSDLVDKLFAMLLPSTLILCGTQYLILHSWLNFTAEILRFGDRFWYSDWWTSADYNYFYRTWNTVVSEWFSEYIFKDTIKYICKHSKVCASLVVFYLSAVIHEHALSISLQMFYPVSFVFFGGTGVLFFFITSKLPIVIGKVFFWWSLVVGFTFNLSMYSMEFFARRNFQFRFNNDTWIKPQMNIPLSWNFIDFMNH